MAVAISIDGSKINLTDTAAAKPAGNVIWIG